MWTEWINHDFSGFPSHILKEGMLVEVELIYCCSSEKNYMTFRVGSNDVNCSNEAIEITGFVTDEGGWIELNGFTCIIDKTCYPKVGRYRYRKPEQSEKLRKIALDTAI